MLGFRYSFLNPTVKYAGYQPLFLWFMIKNEHCGGVLIINNSAEWLSIIDKLEFFYINNGDEVRFKI